MGRTLVGVATARVVHLAARSTGLIGMVTVCSGLRRELLEDSDVDNHVVAEVFIPRNESIAVFVLEANPLRSGRTRVEAIKVLYRRHNRVGCVMGVNLHSHRQARTVLRSIEEEEFKCDILGSDRLAGGDAPGTWGVIGMSDRTTRR